MENDFSRVLDRNGSITLNMVLNVHRNRLIRERGYGGGGRGRLYIPITTLSPPE